MNSGFWQRKKLIDKFMHGLFLMCAFISSAVLIGILLMLFVNGVQTFKEVPLKEFFFTAKWNPQSYWKPSFGILAILWGSFITTTLALLLAIPFGIASALFISEKLSGSLRLTVKTIIELFAGFPSVVLGFFGLTVIAPLISKVFGVSSGLNLLNASLILAMMSLPTIISVSEDAIRLVPNPFREAAYGLGATKWQVAVKVVLPAARSGIIAAVLLGFGRAVGETMAVLMVSGNATIFTKSLFDPVRTITSTIAIELGETVIGDTHYYALFALGFILFVISFATNIIAEAVVKRGVKRGF